MSSKKELVQKSKNELVAICKERKLPYSGTKSDLADRILGEYKPKATKKREEKKAAQPEPKCFGIIGKEYIDAVKNAYGNYEEPERHLCFDPATLYVIGKQQGDKLIKISVEDARFCQNKGLQYMNDIVNMSFSKKSQDIEAVLEKALKGEYEESDEEESDFDE
jgi:hypothetical protein